MSPDREPHDDALEFDVLGYTFDPSEENPITPLPTHNAALFFAFAAYLSWVAHTGSNWWLWLGPAVTVLFALDETRRAVRGGR